MRIGNGAFDQRQNDVFGAALDSVLLHTRRSQRLPRRLWPLVQVAGRVREGGVAQARPGDLGGARQAPALRLLEADVLGRARPRREARGDPRRRRPGRRAGRETAAEIKADILEHGVDKRGVLRQHYDTDALDASTLLAAIFGFLPGNDERLRASVLAIADELTENGFVLRYRTDETDDGLSGKEGTFVICSFWLVSALAIIGEMQRARDLMAAPASRSPRRSGCTPRSSTSTPGGTSATSRRRSRTSRWSRPPARIILAERLAEIGVMSNAYDVIVIGSGAGGGTLVHQLAPSGKRILLLERGGWLPREPQNWLAQDVFVDGRYISPDTWYYDDGTSFQPQVHYFVGGATKLYGAALYRLREEDFGELRHHDGISPAWPISYEDMEPYYTQAEQLYQVHGARGEDPTEPPASAPYPFPAVSHEPRIQQLSDDLAKAGLHPFHAPCGILLERGQHAVQQVRALRQLRRLPVRGAREVRRRGDRGAPGDRARQRDAADGRRGGPPSTATTSGTAVTAVEVELDGEPETFTGDIVVVSCGAANSAKLLLASACRRSIRAAWPTALTRSGATTCSTTARPCSRSPRRRTRRSSRRRSGSTTSTSPAARTSSTRSGNIQMVGKSQAPMFRGEKPGETRFAPNWSLRGRRPPRRRLLALDRGSAAAREPRHARREDGNIQISYTPSNEEPKKRLCHKLHDMLGDLGMHHGPSAARTTPTSRTRSRWPESPIRPGTCRFGTDPATSVLNADCRAHEVDNLYVVDTSFFPSIGAVNPALTAMANALRVGDHLLERMGARPAWTGVRACRMTWGAPAAAGW